MPSEKAQLSIVVLGHVASGKSTTTGHLLFKTGSVDARTMRRSEEAAGSIGKDSHKFAFLLDTLKSEREMLCSVDKSIVKLETPQFVFTVIDTPGHRDYAKNMITGTVLADAALLVVAAGEEEFNEGFAVDAQTREHALLAFSLGIKQLVVAVNKMDCDSVQYSEARFEHVKSEVGGYLAKVGFKTSAIPFVPISGWNGDNLADKDETNMPWYDGPCLLDALDSLSTPRRSADKPLRVVIQSTHSIQGVGTIAVGRVETGVLAVGQDVTFGPVNLASQVRSIECHREVLTEAYPGDMIGFRMGGLTAKQLPRGCIVSATSLDPARAAIEFTAQVVILSTPAVIRVGYSPTLHVHSANVACRFKQITERLDRQTGKVVELNPETVKTGDACTVVFEPTTALVVETFQQYPALGRFVIRDMRTVVAVGVIKSVTKREYRIAKKVPSEVTP